MTEVPKLTKEMETQLRAQLKEAFDLTDEQIDKYILASPERLKSFLNLGTRIFDYKMIAKVIKSRNCASKLKPGDRYVFSAAGTLLPDQCTASLCLWALAPMLLFSYIVYSRLNEGLEPIITPNRVKCTDVGIECGGVGEVLFEMSCIKEPWSPEDYLNIKYVVQKKR